MARIVFGAGTSHTPMLLASDETLPRFLETDQKIKHRDKEGHPVTYGDLLEKADPKLRPHGGARRSRGPAECRPRRCQAPAARDRSGAARRVDRAGRRPE